ncbi:MAG: hypothetical protein JXB88_09420 [Spirochaetales bacterium]|nr:hypothetical protein [Spirochaetales bacterium]
MGWKTVNGKTQWEFASDSWPTSDTTWISFYPYYKEVKLENYVNTAWAILPAANGKTISYSGLSTGSYTDNDGDGYYICGFGQSKPSGCPGYSERDGNDNDPELGPIYSNLTYKKLAPKQSFQASSWGAVIGRASVTVKASGTFYWDELTLFFFHILKDKIITREFRGAGFSLFHIF